MPIYLVPVKKDVYRNNQPSSTRTIDGMFEIEAANPEQALNLVKAIFESSKVLQTTDPRIDWEESWEDYGDDETYADWTFDIATNNPADVELDFDEDSRFCSKCGDLLGDDEGEICYCCENCSHSNAVLSDGEEPPTYHCPDCGENFIGSED